jgi:hypothetical protein
MFRALLAHPQEVLQQRHLVYCMRVMSVVCSRFGILLQLWCSQLTYLKPKILGAVCAQPSEDEQVMLEICRGP